MNRKPLRRAVITTRRRLSTTRSCRRADCYVHVAVGEPIASCSLHVAVGEPMASLACLVDDRVMSLTLPGRFGPALDLVLLQLHDRRDPVLGERAVGGDVVAAMVVVVIVVVDGCMTLGGLAMGVPGRGGPGRGGGWVSLVVLVLAHLCLHVQGRQGHPPCLCPLPWLQLVAALAAAARMWGPPPGATPSCSCHATHPTD